MVKGEKDPCDAPKEVAEMLACEEAWEPPPPFYPNPSTCGRPTGERGEGGKEEGERGRGSLPSNLIRTLFLMSEGDL